MAKVKVKKKSTLIDMTAMSDVTVLLLTFFMLTSTFVKKEPVQVVTPASASEEKVPETNVLQILVDTTGRVFLSLDNQKDKEKALERMGQKYNVKFDGDQMNSFKVSTTFGVPMGEMKDFLSKKQEEQDKELKEKGVPIGPADEPNEFKDWVEAALAASRSDKQEDGKGRELGIAIKSDANTPYQTIKLVLDNLKEAKVTRYKLLTTLKTASE